MLKKHRSTLILVLVLLVLSPFSIFLGAYDVTISGLLAGGEHQMMLLLISRIPRLLAIIMTGIGMSIAGLIMQNLCMNKFVSPTTGATIASAQLGYLIAIIFIPVRTIMVNTAFAFAFALLGTWMFVWFIQRIKFKDVVMVPLIGIMFSSVIGAMVSFLAYTYDQMQAITSMLTGSFALVIAGDYEIVFLVLPMIVVAWFYANHFNIVAMGENFSTNLGVNYKLVMFLGLSIAAIITASIVVTVGSISYIGLIVPNIVAMFKGDKIRSSLVDVGLFGAIFVMICDMIGRVLIMPYELPIELIVGIVGSLVFLVLMYIRLNPYDHVFRRFAKQ